MKGALGAVLVLLAGCASPAAPAATPLESALDYLARQRDAGGFPAGLSAYVAEAAVAAGLDPSAWPEGHPVLGDVRVPSDGALLAKVRPLHALALAGAPGAQERRQIILDAFDGIQFGDARLLNDDAFALLALAADGQPRSPEIEAALGHLSRQQTDGGWSYATNGTPSVDVTGFVVVAFAAWGAQADIGPGVVAFLDAARDGAGYAEAPGGLANCDSTVWALRALQGLGEATPEPAWAYLDALQNEDGGLAYRPGELSNALCTAEAATLWGLNA